MRRFVGVGAMREIRGEVRFAARMRALLHRGALDALASVREAHFKLEHYYSSAMDFEAKEKYTKNFCSTLFDLQNSN